MEPAASCPRLPLLSSAASGSGLRQLNPYVSRTEPAEPTANQTRQRLGTVSSPTEFTFSTAVPRLAGRQRGKKTQPRLLERPCEDAAGEAPVFGADGNLRSVQRQQENHPGRASGRWRKAACTRGRARCRGAGGFNKSRTRKPRGREEGGTAGFIIMIFFKKEKSALALKVPNHLCW